MSSASDGSLGKTRLGRWYWNLSDRAMAWFIVAVDLVVWAIGVVFMFATADAPLLVDLWFPLYPAIFVNLGLSIYNTSKI